MKNTPIGLQMFSLSEESDADFVGTLKKVAEVGYDGVEFAGYGGYTAQELKKILQDLDLKVAASHVPIDMLEKEVEQVMTYQKDTANKQIVGPFVFPERRSEKDYYELVPILNHIGKTCHEAGITVSYHNHDFELDTLSNGQKALEMLLGETNPEWVQTEFDIYWLTKAG